MAGVGIQCAYLLWTDLHEVADVTLRRECRNLTAKILAKRGVQSFSEGPDLKELLENAEGADWCAVIWAGSVLSADFTRAVRETIESADADVFMFAHLMDRKKRGYGIHEQFILINRTKWRGIGSPAFRRQEQNETDLMIPNRSVENIHDDYTPLWLKPSAQFGKLTPKITGWNVIDLALRSGFSILNVPQTIRREKEFLYPEKNSEVFRPGFANLVADKKQIPLLPLEEYQKEILLQLEF